MNTLALKSIDRRIRAAAAARSAPISRKRATSALRMLRNPGVAIPVLIMPLRSVCAVRAGDRRRGHRQGSEPRHLPVRRVLDHGGHHAGAVRHRRHARDGARHGAAAAQARAARAAGGLGGGQDRRAAWCSRCSHTRPSSSWRSPPANSRSARPGRRVERRAAGRASIPFCAMGLMIGSLVKRLRRARLRQPGLSTGLLPFGHVLPAARVRCTGRRRSGRSSTSSSSRCISRASRK